MRREKVNLKQNIKNFIKFIDQKIYKKILKFFLKENYFLLPINKNNKYRNTYYFNNLKNDLSILCEKYGSDKGYVSFEKDTPYSWKAHTYTSVYYNLFNHCKNEIKLIFECGIGSTNSNYISNMTLGGKPGASLRVWRDYFKNSLIYGADIDKEILFEEDRIKTFYVDQLNEHSIKEMWSNINKSNFDIIFDDGLHSFEAAITFFLNSFDKLRKNGIYIIEDVGFKYLKKLTDTLSKYNPEIIVLNDNNTKHGNNNLILIRKSLS
jgi:hypothetical protein